MQCETCDRPGTVHVTEINNGKPVDRHFCRQHAQENLKNIIPSDQECSEFYDWIVPYFNQHQQLPPADEIVQHGRIGEFFGRKVKEGWQDMTTLLIERIQKRAAAAAGI